jgi:hypothetical protein
VCSGFRKKSCSNKKLKRDDDSTKSHPALADFLDYLCAVSLTEATDVFDAGHRFTAEARSVDFRYSGKFRFIELGSLQGFHLLSFRRRWKPLFHPNFGFIRRILL